MFQHPIKLIAAYQCTTRTNEERVMIQFIVLYFCQMAGNEKTYIIFI